MSRAGAITAAAALGMLAAAAAAETVAGRRPAPSGVTEHIDGGGYRLAVTDRGSQPTPDTPAVVIVTGAGDCQASWAAVADRLADHTRVITYDRAGLGWSARGPAPTADRYVTELRAVLDARLPEGTYVLVGHSLGGLIARLRAQQHTERLAGLVQVDATPEQVADDPGVKIGFAVSGMLASAFKALAPIGVVRLLLRLRAFPLYPEQRTFETQLTADQRRAWMASVRRDMGPGGASGSELRPSCRPCARRSGGWPGLFNPSSVTFRWRCSPAMPGAESSGSTCTASSPRAPEPVPTASSRTGSTTSTCSIRTRWSTQSTRSWSPGPTTTADADRHRRGPSTT